MEIREYPGRKGTLQVEPLPDGRHRLHVKPGQGHAARVHDWTTAYPLELLLDIHAVKDLSVCDEIMRDEDPRYVERRLKNEVLGYMPAAAFGGRRILDFGCGSGASSLVLARMLPPCEIVGIELDARLLGLARRRAQHFGRTSLQWLLSPARDSLPPELGMFDFVMLNAVYEHMLPDERRVMLPLVWRHLRPGGVLFLNQTPYRYSPVELHTTGGMPFINYLPDAAAAWVARRFCRRVERDESWESLLRRGIRGATVPEIVALVGGPARAELLQPLAGSGDRIDLWCRGLSPRHHWIKQFLRASMKLNKALTGREITPQLSLALRKRDLSAAGACSG